MVSDARRRAVRVRRLWNTWPLWWAGTAAVGLAAALTGWAAGRETWLVYGLALATPSLLLLAWVGAVLSLAAVLNVGAVGWDAVWRVVRPPTWRRGQ